MGIQPHFDDAVKYDPAMPGMSLAAMDAQRAMLILVASSCTREGPKGRTISATLGSLTKSETKTPRGTVPDYIQRQGKWLAKDDLESATATRDPDTGRPLTPERMSELLTLVANNTERKNGGVARTLMSELPAILDAEGRRQIMLDTVDWFEKTGRPTLAAVHVHGDPERSKLQPHLHLICTFRPVDLVTNTVVPEGRPHAPDRTRIIIGPDEVKKWRKEVLAPIINRALEKSGHHGNWHGGDFADVGIDRPAQIRIPLNAWLAGDHEPRYRTKDMDMAKHQAWVAETEAKRKARRSKLAAQAERRRQRLERIKGPLVTQVDDLKTEKTSLNKMLDVTQNQRNSERLILNAVQDLRAAETRLDRTIIDKLNRGLREATKTQRTLLATIFEERGYDAQPIERGAIALTEDRFVEIYKNRKLLDQFARELVLSRSTEYHAKARADSAAKDAVARLREQAMRLLTDMGKLERADDVKKGGIIDIDEIVNACVAVDRERVRKSAPPPAAQSASSAPSMQGGATVIAGTRDVPREITGHPIIGPQSTQTNTPPTRPLSQVHRPAAPMEPVHSQNPVTPSPRPQTAPKPLTVIDPWLPLTCEPGDETRVTDLLRKLSKEELSDVKARTADIAGRAGQVDAERFARALTCISAAQRDVGMPERKRRRVTRVRGSRSL